MIRVIASHPREPGMLLVFHEDAIMFGRHESNHIVLEDKNISRRHGRVLVRNDALVIVDFKSTNGISVDGRRVRAPQGIGRKSLVRVGDWRLIFDLTRVPDAGPEARPILRGSRNVLLLGEDLERELERAEQTAVSTPPLAVEDFMALAELLGVTEEEVARLHVGF